MSSFFSPALKFGFDDSSRGPTRVVLISFSLEIYARPNAGIRSPCGEPNMPLEIKSMCTHLVPVEILDLSVFEYIQCLIPN
jgi:hypothetical protein